MDAGKNVATIIGTSDIESVTYLMSLIVAYDKERGDLLNLRHNIELWCANPKNGYKGGPKTIINAFNNIWKTAPVDRVRALAKFLLSAGDLLPAYKLF